MNVRILALLCLCLAPLSSANTPPNIVVFISDDMGFSDLGCYGGEINTPHLDALAAGGVRFKNYYVNNMCWPTRASIMTGLYAKTALPHKGSASGGLHPEATTLPAELKQAGYTTLMSGKWHLSNPAEPNGPHAPHNRGFDKFYGTIHGASDFFAPADLILNGKDMTHEWKDNPDYFYTDAITDHALTFLKEKPAEQPFFLYVAYTSAHWPLHAKPADIAAYKGTYAMGWDKLREQRFARMKKLGVIGDDWELSKRHPDVPAWDEAEHKAWQERRMEVYAAQVSNMDWNIGRVVQHLKHTGVFDNTLVLYQHDNGGCHVEYTTTRTGSWSREFTTDGKQTPIKSGNIPGLMPGPQSTFQSYGYGWANASNTPFRLFKQYDHEGGTRSPLIASWPAGMRTAVRGDYTSRLCHVIDLMPTLLDAAGVYHPGKQIQQPMPIQGRSFLDAFSNRPSSYSLKPRDALFWAHAKGRAIRIHDWKLVAAGKGKWELYDLSQDPIEANNLAGDMPEKVREMEERFRAWEQRTDLGKKKKKKKK